MVDMVRIEFYFDSSCPFCWITSRWLLVVQKKRDIDITWRQFSLALKNDEIIAKTDENSHAGVHRESHRVHRVIAAATQNNSASTVELYSEFGASFHILGKRFDDDLIRTVLSNKHLPEELLGSADDETIDDFLQSEIDSATQAAGGDIGVPTIVFLDTNNNRVGYFGPVLNELPSSEQESLDLWDGLEKLAVTPSFYELKRTRSGDPNVFSASRC